MFMVSLSQRLPVTIRSIVDVLISIRRSLGVPGPHGRAQRFMLWSVFVVMANLCCSVLSVPVACKEPVLFGVLLSQPLLCLDRFEWQNHR